MDRKLIAIVIWLFCVDISNAESPTRVYEVDFPTYFDPIENNGQLSAVDSAFPLRQFRPLGNELHDCGLFRDSEFRCHLYEPREGTVPLGSIGDSVVARGVPPWPAPLPAIGENLGLIYEAGLVPDSNGINTSFSMVRHVNLSGANYAWVPLSDVIESARVGEDWRQLANQVAPYACASGICSILVNAWSFRDELRIDGIAVCSVRRVGVDISTPGLCQFVLVDIAGETYIVAPIYYYYHAYGMAGRTDFMFSIRGLDSRLSQSPELEHEIGVVFSRALSGPPLELETSIQGDGVVGIADYRYFDGLERWTLQTIRVFRSGRMGFQVDGELEAAPVFSVATTLYISAQNSADSRDWRLPTPQQNARYVEIVRTRILEEISNSCEGFQVSGGSTIYEVTCYDWAHFD